MAVEDIILRDKPQGVQLSPGKNINGDDGDHITPKAFQASPLDRRSAIAQEDIYFPQEGLSKLANDKTHPPDTAAYRKRNQRRQGK